MAELNSIFTTDIYTDEYLIEIIENERPNDVLDMELNYLDSLKETLNDILNTTKTLLNSKMMKANELIVRIIFIYPYDKAANEILDFFNEEFKNLKVTLEIEKRF